MAQVNILFKTDFGSYIGYEDSNQNTSKHTYVTVDVKTGTWILYQQNDYNASSAGGAQVMIVNAGDTPKDLPYSPESIWRANDARDTATLFEHTNYSGKRKIYQTGCSDITSDFPPNDPRGVSSMIIGPGKVWQLFAGTNYKPEPGELAEPNWYRSFTIPDPIIPNDKLASLRPL